jgi:adenylate cyclase
MNATEAALRINPKPDPYESFDAGWVYFFNRRYDCAIRYFANTRDRAPKSFLGYLGLAVSYAELGQIEEAKSAVGSLLEILPPYSISLRFVSAQHWRKTLYDHWHGALRKAGLPDWPYGFEGEENGRLKGSEIRSPLLGRRITGRCRNGAEFDWHIAVRLAYRRERRLDLA